eukprot:1148184-Pleurochrysis_carterae.AAC.1
MQAFDKPLGRQPCEHRQRLRRTAVAAIAAIAIAMCVATGASARVPNLYLDGLAALQPSPRLLPHWRVLAASLPHDASPQRRRERLASKPAREERTHRLGGVRRAQLEHRGAHAAH